MTARRGPWRGVYVLAALLSAAPAEAQFIRGYVRDAENRDRLEGAFAAVIDTSGDVVTAASTDRRGKYEFKLPHAGIFAIVASSPGYLRQVSEWMSLGLADSVEVNTTLGRYATRLTPVIVKAQRDSLRELTPFGLNLKAFGGHIMTELEVSEAASRAMTAYDLVQALHVPGLQISYRLDTLSLQWYQCVQHTRSRGCVTTVIDGVLQLNDAYNLDQLITPRNIKYMVFLTATEAATVYGTAAATNGVLFIVTRRNDGSRED